MTVDKFCSQFYIQRIYLPSDFLYCLSINPIIYPQAIPDPSLQQNIPTSLAENSYIALCNRFPLDFVPLTKLPEFSASNIILFVDSTASSLDFKCIKRDF